ncbi:Type II secretion system protein F [Posidoniimonas corsicana]|uniref:Type II secretion system protein F n=1 Tax=Posidoniimonas corsicana TaxID=1938618 RepID=A0A5C5VK09_9BACT|nr:type II secretion system F family protein [Posidoniimonas corsicana]TWT38209.1 Type II secretion system protein F [Posidoniimonas corsicana]
MPAPTIDDLITLNQEILAIARARVPVAGELVAAAKQMPAGAAMLAELIANELEKGKTLDQAVAAQQARLPKFYTAVVAAGVNAGRLPAALEGLSEALSRMRSLRWRVLSAFVYPLFVVALAWVLAVVAATYLAPTFDWMELGRSPAINALRVSPTVFWPLVLSVPIALSLLALVNFIGAMRARRSFSTGVWLADRLPGVRAVCRWTAYANFAELLSLLTAHRAPLPEALRMAGDAVDWRPLSDAAGSLATEVEAGKPVESAGPSLRRLPPLVRLALLSSADQPSLAALLAQGADSYHRRALASLNNLGLFLPAAATALVGGSAVAVYALLVLGPYFNSLSDLARP